MLRSRLELSGKQRALLQGVALALDAYEPFPLFFAPRTEALPSLVSMGLVEEGPSNRPSVSPKGYRRRLKPNRQ
jgi:hypothetical protein